MGSHLPNKAEQMVRYYGYYSNVSRGKRGKLNLDEPIPCTLMSEEGAKKYRKKCQGRMKIISFIEDEEVIEKILKHLGLWEMKARPSPKPKASLVTTHFDYSDSHISFASSFYADPEYPIDFYMSSLVHRVIYSTFQSIIFVFQSNPT